MSTQVFSVKVRIARPLDATWDDVGPRLRELSWVAHRVLNGTIRRLELAAEVPEMVPAAWKSTERPDAAKNKGGKVGSYPMARESLDVANAHRKGGAVEDVPPTIQLGWARTADRRFKNDRKEILRGNKSLSTWRSPAPIVVTSGQAAWSLRHDGCGYVLGVPLYAGGASGSREFALAPDGKNAWAHLQRMVLDGAKLGDCKLLAPRANKKSWLVALSYSVDVAEPTPRAGEPAALKVLPDGTIAVCVAGRRPRKVYEGESIAHKRRMFAARRSSRSKHQRDIGAGARGHGRARALEHYHAVDDAEARWRKSICQEIAAKAAREADLRGCSWVDIDESIAKVLPPAEMRGAVQWALQRAGFAPPAKTSPRATSEKGSSS